MVNINSKKLVKGQASWERDVTTRLPALLEQLLDSEIYGLGDDRPDPPRAYGVYLFSSTEGEPLYVGRVGLTERARRKGQGAGHSSLLTRLRQHTRPVHTQGTWAYRRALVEYEQKVAKDEEGYEPLPGKRKENCKIIGFKAEFKLQCELVKAMQFRIVELHEDEDEISTVFEVYAATVLGLGQSFATS